MAYTVTLRDSARRQLHALPREMQQRILAKIEALDAHPRPPGAIKLAGQENLYRIRVGNYRVIYEIHDLKLVVLVVVVAHRRDSYRGL